LDVNTLGNLRARYIARGVPRITATPVRVVSC
jgi:hypothetical protein